MRPTDEVLKRDYEIVKLSLSAIAKKYDVSRPTVREWMRKAGIVVDSNPQLQRPAREELERLYVTEREGLPQIADRFSVSTTAVLRWLKHYGIKTRSAVEAQHNRFGRSIDTRPDRSVLEDLYIKQEQSFSEIARTYNVSVVTARNWCKHYGIETRPHHVTQTLTARRHAMPSVDELHDLYVTKKMSQIEVAAHYGVSWITVKKWQRKMDIQTRIGKVPGPIPPRDDLGKLYNEQMWPTDRIGRHYGVSRSTVTKWMEHYGIERVGGLRSNGEIDLINSLNAVGGAFVNSRRALPRAELDGYDKDRKLAVEYNGLYWHCDDRCHPLHLLEKTGLAAKHDIRLIHVFENEWQQKREIVMSILTGLLGRHLTIGARKLTVEPISSDQFNQFCETNHLQGSAVTKVRLGLFRESELVAVAGFGTNRFSDGWELIRYCSQLNVRVVGGLARLFKAFVTEHKPSKVVSYADRRYFTGRIYEELGFRFVRNTRPNYFYFKPNELKLYSRMSFQKHKLANKLQKFDPALSEYENMCLNGFKRIWDCGNVVYEWTP